MANINILAGKQEIINEIKDNIEHSNTVVFFEYHGLTVHDMMELRRKLKEVGANLKIYKNTLVVRALNTLNYDLSSDLMGPKAMAYGEEAITPIKVLDKFAKDHPALVLKVGIVDQKVTDEKTLLNLAKLPSRQELLTMLAGSLLAPIRDLAICLDLHNKNLGKEN